MTVNKILRKISRIRHKLKRQYREQIELANKLNQVILDHPDNL